MEARMQYNYIYKQITYLNRTINLTITKQKTKIKTRKDTGNDLHIFLEC